LAGNGDISVQTIGFGPDAQINWSNSNSLTLSAYRNINIDAGATITNTGGGNLVLRADSTGTGAGTVNFAPGTTPGNVNFQSSTGTVSIYYNPTAQTFSTKYQNPTNFLCSTSSCGGVFVNQPSQLTAYMLVNSASDLQLVSTNLGGTYALGRSFSAAGFSGFAPGSIFTGLFDGNGGLGVNYTISDLSLASSNAPVALFPFIESGATVRNLNLANVNIAGTGSLIFVAPLAGENRGTISDVHVLSGNVSGGSQSGVAAGGLVAQNKGLIQNSSSAANVSVGNSNLTIAFNAAGGLVGTNLGTITGSSASGNVSGGAASLLGGLVGENGFFGSGAASISSSFATGSVSGGAGINASLGGLVGLNSPGSTITGSSASGNVTSTASVLQNGPNCAASNSCQTVAAGGLAGQNFGTIANSSARGNVSVGSNGTGGGLVGFNGGIIANAFASGNVTGLAGTSGLNGQGGSTTLGGLAGNNQGLISGSSASGNVGSPNVANVQAGGLVGDNSGTILASVATGNVRAGSTSVAGGLVGSNSPANNFNCPGCSNADGSAYFNSALISGSQAGGNVSVGAGSVAGGFAGASDGVIALSSATGAVSGGGNSILGGFIGALGFSNGLGFVSASTSSGPVTSTGPNSIVGGFAGINGGTILLSSASSPVTGTSESYLGGFAGVNLGTIMLSSSSGAVTGTGNHDIIGGFVGANFGRIDSSSSAGAASGSTNSAVGGFAGANARYINFSAGSIPGSSFPVGTITNSTATGAASGGPGSTVDPFIALNDPSSASNLPAFPSILAGCSDPLCGFLNTGILPPPGSQPPAVPQPLSPFSPEFRASLPGQVQVINNLVGIGPNQLAALNTAPVIDTSTGGVRLPRQQQRQQPSPPAGAQNLPPGFDRRIIDIPPITETRLINNEALVQIATTNSIERLRAAVATLGLEVIASENIAITGSTAVRLRIPDGRNLRDVLQSLAGIQLFAVVQPVYVFRADQQDTAPASRGDSGPKGDAAQYVLEKLKISDVHRMVRGNNVPIAVIDSQIDAAHPDLEGVIAESFSAVGTPEKPHSHGTGMAGAIASHQRLLGTAPGARLLAVHAFSTAGNSESTTFNILKGIDWSVRQGARIINMSFAGPKDPSLERVLKLAYDKGIVLIAAAGNAGPKSPPAFPGADPNVIAVTATDVDDKLFTGANRGKYISVAAPGVDILVPAPEGDYQITTGTSVAAAEVSGIVALLLERNPKLTPADIRRILTMSAKRLAPGERDDNFGSGLIDPIQALQLADPRTATTTPPAPARPIRQR
jgi:Subtilase family/M26 IgA1-specific Metallo-endopeptidase N-terminal region